MCSLLTWFIVCAVHLLYIATHIRGLHCTSLSPQPAVCMRRWWRQNWINSALNPRTCSWSEDLRFYSWFFCIKGMECSLDKGFDSTAFISPGFWQCIFWGAWRKCLRWPSPWQLEYVAAGCHGNISLSSCQNTSCHHRTLPQTVCWDTTFL